MYKLLKIAEQLQILAADDSAVVFFKNLKNVDMPIQIEVPFINTNYSRIPHLVDTAYRKAIKEGLDKDSIGNVLYIKQKSNDKIIYETMSSKYKDRGKSYKIIVVFTNSKEPEKQIPIELDFQPMHAYIDYIPLALKKAKETGIDMKTIGNVLLIKDNLGKIVYDPVRNLR
jgi:hypothetical protein